MRKIKKGDIVEVITGKDKGKQGKVLKVFPKTSRIIVEGVNFQKKHYRARRAGEQSQIITREGPIHISNVKLVCPKCGQPTRVGFKIVGDRKLRYCKKCQELVDE